MSLILDALKRSQQERDSINDMPGIETHHPIEPLAPVNGWRRSFPWVCLVLSLAVIVWLLTDGEAKTSAPPAVVKSSEAEKLVPEAAVSPTTSVTIRPQLTEQPAEKPALLVSKVEEPSHDAEAVEDLYKKNTQEQGVVPKVVIGSASQEKVQVQDVVDQPAITEQAVDIEKMIALAKAETENAALAEHSAPFLSELSQQLKDQVPTIYYSLHDFSSNSSQSSVTLNGKILRAGSTMASAGLKVDEILSASVVLSYKGTQFRLKALNSWVNL